MGSDANLARRRIRTAWSTLVVSVLVLGLVAFLAVRFWKPFRPSVVLSNDWLQLAALLDSRKLGSGPPATDAGTFTLDREPIDEQTARLLFPPLLETRRFHYDRLAYFRPGREIESRRDREEHLAGGWFVNTNSLGMRGSDEVLAARPDWRVLVVGDSHSFGLCADDETFAHLLEERLHPARADRSVEVLNASVGACGPWNYLGTVESFLELEPDLVLIVLYGGNDFSGTMTLERYFHRRGTPRATRIGRVALQRYGELGTAAISQELGQVLYFESNPEDEQVAAETVVGIATQAHVDCQSRGARLLCVLLPSPATVQPDPFLPLLAPVLTAYGLHPGDLEISDRLGDQWIASLREREIPALDLRPAIRDREAPCYWLRDLHLNVDGHRVVAAALEPIVLELLR